MENFAEKEDIRVGERIDSLINLFETKKEASELAGVSVEQLKRWTRGLSKPPFTGIAKLCAAQNISLDFIYTGLSPAHVEHPKNTDTPIISDKDFALVPQLNIEASAGLGITNGDHELVENHLAFKKSWLKQHNINPAFASAITVTGDSMDPTIRNGDTLLIDTSISEIRDNGIYIVVVNGMTMVKRVHIKLSRSITLISDNKNYPDEEIVFDDTHQLRIAGRVMWFGRGI